MIFLTVGTHEQPFDRIIEYIDRLKKNGIIEEEVVIQTGYSTIEPKYCTWQKLYSYSQMTKLVSDARIVITHGGPSSFIMPLQIGKIPIVVPRQKKFNEHVNDHQVKFTKEISKRTRNIITVVDVENLGATIINYNIIVSGMDRSRTSNNARFCNKFEKLVDEIFNN